MQTQTNPKTPVHIKVQHNEEFRRFSLSETTFSVLDTKLRTLFNIPSEPLKIKFLDDEKDWILISSDMELEHAIEILILPIRVQVSLSQASVVFPPCCEPVKQSSQPEVPEPSEEFCWKRRGGCGHRGMGRGCGGRGPMISKEERLALKKARLAGRISALETALLDPSLPPERERTLSWKLENLKYKMETFDSIKDSLASEGETECPGPWRHGFGCGPCDGGEQASESEVPCRGHFGRGRGGRRGRGRQESHQQQEVPVSTATTTTTTTEPATTAVETDHVCGKKWAVPKEVWAHFQECKENLKVARRSGDPLAIKNAYEAFVLAKEQKKESRYPK